MTTKTKKTYTKPATTVDLYQAVTDKIIAKMEQGELSWRKPWNNYGLAKNYVSGKTYQGINMLLLNMFSSHDVPYYLTYKQALDLGGNVKKGAKSEQVYFFNVIFKDENGKTISQEQAQASGQKIRPIKFLKYFNVFNVADVEGIDFKIPEVKLLPHERIANCEKVVAGYVDAPQLREKLGSQASYAPSLDLINMPELGQFKTVESYYATFFHEMIHSTGAEKRLNREGVSNFDKFGTDRYSFEELIAELGCAFLCGSAGIDNESLIDNSAAYIQGWISKLKNDKNLIFKAASSAQKAVNYILGDTLATAFRLTDVIGSELLHNYFKTTEKANMKSKDLAYIKANGHLDGLIKFGLNESDVHLLYALENLANGFMELCCNIEVSDAEQEKVMARYWRRLAKYFNMEVADAEKVFKFNHDPRGYTLKLRNSVTDHQLKYRDMGDNYIICPEAPIDWKPQPRLDARTIVVRDDIML